MLHDLFIYIVLLNDIIYKILYDWKLNDTAIKNQR